MLECIYHPPWKGPESKFFTVIVRNKFMNGAPTSLKSSMVALSCRSEIAVGIAATESEALSAIGTIGPCGGRGQGWHILAKGKVDMVTIMDSRVKAVSRIV